jgi:hypothetical protein
MKGNSEGRMKEKGMHFKQKGINEACETKWKVCIKDSSLLKRSQGYRTSDILL